MADAEGFIHSDLYPSADGKTVRWTADIILPGMPNRHIEGEASSIEEAWAQISADAQDYAEADDLIERRIVRRFYDG